MVLDSSQWHTNKFVLLCNAYMFCGLDMFMNDLFILLWFLLAKWLNPCAWFVFILEQWEALVLLLIGISVNQLKSVPEGTAAMGLPVATVAYLYTLIFVSMDDILPLFLRILFSDGRMFFVWYPFIVTNLSLWQIIFCLGVDGRLVKTKCNYLHTQKCSQSH